MICIITKYLSDQINKNEMSRACSMYGAGDNIRILYNIKMVLEEVGYWYCLDRATCGLL
jgi:hypothetical protein